MKCEKGKKKAKWGKSDKINEKKRRGGSKRKKIIYTQVLKHQKISLY